MDRIPEEEKSKMAISVLHPPRNVHSDRWVPCGRTGCRRSDATAHSWGRLKHLLRSHCNPISQCSSFITSWCEDQVGQDSTFAHIRDHWIIQVLLPHLRDQEPRHDSPRRITTWGEKKRQIASFFSPFAPWDRRFKHVLGLDLTHLNSAWVAIAFHAHTLLDFGAIINASGYLPLTRMCPTLHRLEHGTITTTMNGAGYRSRTEEASWSESAEIQRGWYRGRNYCKPHDRWLTRSRTKRASHSTKSSRRTWQNLKPVEHWPSDPVIRWEAGLRTSWRRNTPRKKLAE